MTDSEVVVTGIGMVTPLGATASATAEAWRAGQCARRAPLPELAGTSLEEAEVAVLPDFDAAARLGGRKMLKYMSEAAVLGCTAAREACQGAQVQRRFAPERVGLFAATGLASISVGEVLPLIRASIDGTGQFSCRLLGERGLTATSPLLSFRILANMPPCLVSIQERIRGPSYIFSPWEGQGGAALLEAWAAVRDGEVDCAVTGAADYPVSATTLLYLKQAGLLREGECPAPGAAYVVMETAASARRGAMPIVGTIGDIRLTRCGGCVQDALASRMGRSFAAAPAIAVAVACLTGGTEAVVCGADRQRLEVRFEAAA